MKTHAMGKITLLADKEEWCMECKLKLKDSLKLEVPLIMVLYRVRVAGRTRIKLTQLKPYAERRG